jgi:hypothetical protein
MSTFPHDHIDTAQRYGAVTDLIREALYPCSDQLTIRGLAQQLQHVGASRSSKASSAAGTYSRSWCRRRWNARVRSQIGVFCGLASTLMPRPPGCRVAALIAAGYAAFPVNPLQTSRDRQPTVPGRRVQLVGVSAHHVGEPQRSILPVTGRGTIFRELEARETKVRTCRRPPATESAGWRTR